MEPSAGTFCRVTFCRKVLAEGSKAPALAEGGRRSHPIREQPYIYMYIHNYMYMIHLCVWSIYDICIYDG